MMWYCNFVLFVLLSVLGIGTTQTISSVGDRKNEKFIWATGVPSLSFSFNYSCSSDCRYNWWHDGIRLGIVDTSSCTELFSYVKMLCTPGGMYVYSIITISNQFNDVGVKSLQVVPDSGTTVTQQITIRNCTSSSANIDNATSYINTSATCDYNCSTPVFCKDTYESSGNPTAVCQYDATWLQNNQCTKTTTAAPLSPTMISDIVTNSATTQGNNIGTTSGSEIILARSTASSITTQGSGSSSGQQLEGWKIFLIVFGILIGVFLIMFIIWWFCASFRDCLHNTSSCFPEDRCCDKEYSKGSSS